MKITKSGEVKLSLDDYRIGNFVFSDEGGFIKLQDINRTISIRVSKRIVAGQILEKIIKEKNKRVASYYSATMFNLLCCLFDVQLMEEVSGSVISCVNRHKEFYNIKDDISAEEDNRILKEENNMRDFVDKATQMPKEENQPTQK